MINYLKVKLMRFHRKIMKIVNKNKAMNSFSLNNND